MIMFIITIRIILSVRCQMLRLHASRTVGKNQVVDELILSFTHDIEIKSMLPWIQPTGKYVELPHVVVMKFRENIIAHEHVYWDESSLLTQIGMLEPRNMPTRGIEQSQKLKELFPSQ